MTETECKRERRGGGESEQERENSLQSFFLFLSESGIRNDFP